MDLVTLTKLVMGVSVVLVVVSVGMSTNPGTALRLLKQPAMVLKAMLAMFVAMPLFTLLVTWMLPLETDVRIALLALSLSPMPPVMPVTQVKLGADFDYAIGIDLAATVTALATAPLFILLFENVYHRDVAFTIGPMLKVLLTTISVPLILGILVNHFAPAFATRARGPVGKAASVTMAIGTLIMIAVAWQGIWGAIGNGTLLAILLMTVFGLFIGHLLGGPVAGNRSALAAATATRHPGVALALGAMAHPGEMQNVVGAVLLYILAGGLFTLPYTRWAKARTA